MRTEDVLKTANDTIVVSADEPLARSVEQYVEAMQRQYGFSEEEIRAAVDIAVLSQRQERMIDERIRAYIAQHPCCRSAPDRLLRPADQWRHHR